MTNQAPQQIDAQRLQQKLAQTPPPLVVDVRSAAETAEGVIAGATLIPLDQLQARAAELPEGREIVTVCKMGMRSLSAAAFLRQRGLDASSLAGGMTAWAAAGLPVKR